VEEDAVMSDRWSTADIPDLHGVSVVVTGANSGLGLHTVLGLVRAGARVVMACRDEERGRQALDRVRREVPDADALVLPLDLADLASVRRFAGTVPDAVHGNALDLLVNNAGVMAIPRRETADGFEMQLGTNHLGHFALTGLLLPALLRGHVAGGPPRVVTVSSAMHRNGAIDHDDLMREHDYKAWSVYSQSKLANLLFMRELQRRVDAAGLSLLSLAAHPGYAATNLQAVGPQMSGSKVGGAFMKLGNLVFAQSAAHGAWPTLRAATDPAAKGGEYYGPRGLGEQRGRPKRVGMTAAARDETTATWLWDRSAELTGVTYEELKSPNPA
jgi:NAD(P)-dependent dehydrogenase (short-subunit alcohol dehydrogenase family)